MPQFERHFSLAEARAMLPKLKRFFQELHDLRDAIRAAASRHQGARDAADGNGGGGERAGSYIEANARFQQIIREINQRGIQVKDINSGLVDFPHLREGKEVFLCWKVGEDTISYWHEIESGYSGRKLLE